MCGGGGWGKDVCLWEWVYGGWGRFEEACVCVLVNLGMGVWGVGVGGCGGCVCYLENRVGSLGEGF